MVAGGNLGTVTVLVEDSRGIVVTTSTASVTVTIRLASLVVIQRRSASALVRAAPRLPAR